MPKKALVIRYGAYGDLLVALPLIEELKRRFEYVHLETGNRGFDLLNCHTALNTISTFDVLAYGRDNSQAVANIRTAGLYHGNKWDFNVNLWQTLEVDCIAEDWQEEFYWPREKRQAHFRDRIFVERPYVKSGIPIPKDFRMGTYYFDTQTMLWMRGWREQHHKTFNIVFVVSGSTCQKVPQGLRDIALRISNEYPDARFWLLGAEVSGWMPTRIDPKDLQFDLGRKNVCKLVGKTPYRQAMALVKMADYVIGPVSSLLHGAGLFGTPKTMICTDCSVRQACLYHNNDFSVQAGAACSPCHRAIYEMKYCLTEKTPLGELPACNVYYDRERIMEGVAFAHSIRKLRWDMDEVHGNGYSAIPDFSRGKTSVPPTYGRHGLTRVEELIGDRTGLNIVELGMTRRWGSQYREGYSTPFFAHLALKNGHQFYSLDINPELIPLNERILRAHGLLRNNVHIICGDGLEFLRKWTGGNIDVLYLDAWDYEPDDLRRRGHFHSEAMHLRAMKVADRHMPSGALMLVDDMLCNDTTMVGKGTRVIPWLAERGWECEEQGWQVLMRKP